MALSKAELQAVIDMASLIPGTLQDDVHLTFSAGFIVNLLSTVIVLKDSNLTLVLEKEAAVAHAEDLQMQLTVLQEAPVKVDPLEEEVKP